MKTAVEEPQDKLFFECRSCQRRLAVPVELAGVVGPCPGCGATIRAPQTAESLFATGRSARASNYSTVSAGGARVQESAKVFTAKRTVTEMPATEKSDVLETKRSRQSSSRGNDAQSRYEREELRSILKIAAATGAVLFICLLVRWYLETSP